MADNRGSIYEVFRVDIVENDAKKLESIVSHVVDHVIKEDKRLQEVQLGILGSKNISDMAANSQKVNQMLQNQKKNVDDLIATKKQELELDRIAIQVLKNKAAEEKYNSQAQLSAHKVSVAIAKEKERAESQMLITQKKQLDELLKSKKDELQIDKLSAQNNKAKADALRANTQAELAAYRLIVEMNREKERLEKLQKKEEESLRKQSSAYEQLKKQYNEAAKAALDLGARTNANHPEFIAAAINVKKLHDQLYALESAIGRSQRNVGNYKAAWNGLNNAIAQIARELPTMGSSVNAFIMSMSNQWGALKDELDAIKMRNAELVAQGKEAVPIWKHLTSSIISWNTAISVGVTLLTVFGPKLWGMLTNSSAAAKEAEKANKKYAESLKNIEENAMTTAYAEVSRLKLLEQVATDETATREKRNKAIMEMRDMGSDYLKLYDDEAIKAGKAKDAIKELTEAMVQNAVAKAASDKYAAAYLRERELAKAEEKAVNELVVAKQKMASFDAGYAKQLEGLRGQREENAVLRLSTQKNSLQNDIDAAQKSYDSIYNQRTNAIKEYQEYQNQASEAMQKIPNLFGKPKKEKNTSTYDSTNKELDNDKRLLEARAALRKIELEQSAANSKAVVDYDENSLEQRMVALTEYFESKRAIMNIDKNTELAEIENKLQKIEEIEGKSVDKRTKQEKALLTEKETLEAEKAAISAKYAVKENDIMVDSNKLYTKIVDDEIKKAEDKHDKKIAYEKKVEAEKRKIWKETATEEEKEEKERLKRRLEGLRALRSATSSIFESIEKLSKQKADREIANIQREADNVDKQTERQIAALDKLGLKDEDYDTAKADIEARAEDRKKRLAENEAARAERQADFEKGMAILKATLALYVGIAQEIEKGGVIGIATGAAVAAYMATVIATLSSTSVPQYAEGTDNHPGGAAIVGEGIDRRTGKYKPEVVKEPGRSPYWVLGPSMLNLPSGTEVLTVDDLIADAGSLDTFESYPVVTQSGDNKNVVQAINGLRADMRNMPQPGNIIRNGELFTVIKRGKEKSIYLNANNR